MDEWFFRTVLGWARVGLNKGSAMGRCEVSILVAGRVGLISAVPREHGLDVFQPNSDKMLSVTQN